MSQHRLERRSANFIPPDWRLFSAGFLAAVLCIACSGSSSPRVSNTTKHRVSSMVLIVMEATASAREIGDVRARITSDQMTKTIVLRSQHDGFAELMRSKAVRLNPELFASVIPTDIPAIFRIRLKNGHYRRRFDNRVERMPAVDAVIPVTSCRTRLPVKERTRAATLGAVAPC